MRMDEHAMRRPGAGRRAPHIKALAGVALASAMAMHSIAPAQHDMPAPAPATAPAAPDSPAAIPADGPAYPVSAFHLRYLREHPAHPPIDELLNVPIVLGRTPDGYVAPRDLQPAVQMTLAQTSGRGSETYYASAIQHILETLRDALSARQLIGVYVAPEPSQISTTGQDLRPAGEHELTLVITTGILTELRTVDEGERVSDKGPIKPEERINNPVHQRILERSPFQPHNASDAAAPRRDLLNKEALDRYLFHLSRHPGRRVDAALAGAVEVGGMALDYHVTENRPFTLYAQISNTGTRSTDYWRQRFGFFHTQLTNNDDVLSLDYITSWFDKTNAVLGAYEFPLDKDNRVRARLHADWQEFTADQVGFFDDDFEGESWSAGGTVTANIYQRRELFVDAYAGARFMNIQVDNQGFLIEGDEDFIIPTVGLRLERQTEWYSTEADAGLEWWLSGADEAELETLGRTAPDEDPTVFNFSLVHSFYLEPVIDWEGWADPTTPDDSTLAHEVLGSLRAQYSFGERLIPQAQQVVGGLYTVRGYPESVVAGDDVIIGTLEYRMHVPRMFQIEQEPRQLFGRPFRWAPQYVYGSPDWDLILKAFIDAGKVFNSDRLSFEEDETLIGTGVGIELVYRRNIILRLDWGHVLEDVNAGNVEEGSNRAHFVATILF